MDGSEPIFELSVLGTPQPRGSKRPIMAGRGKLIDDNKKSRPWMTLISQEATVRRLEIGLAIIDFPVFLAVQFYFRRPKSHFGLGKNDGKLKPSAPVFHNVKPDLSKLVRCVEDGLTGSLWTDDNLVASLMAQKLYLTWPNDQPSVQIQVFPMDSSPRLIE